jgi:hypothetical protein
MLLLGQACWLRPAQRSASAGSAHAATWHAARLLRPLLLLTPMTVLRPAMVRHAAAGCYRVLLLLAVPTSPRVPPPPQLLQAAVVGLCTPHPMPAAAAQPKCLRLALLLTMRGCRAQQKPLLLLLLMLLPLLAVAPWRLPSSVAS